MTLRSPSPVVSRSAGRRASSRRELTRDNVDKVLDEVRPYLIADGGNIVVVDVDTDKRVITLALQGARVAAVAAAAARRAGDEALSPPPYRPFIIPGACGSCASSTTTMKMGVERVIHENFLDIAEVCVVPLTTTHTQTTHTNTTRFPSSTSPRSSR